MVIVGDIPVIPCENHRHHGTLHVTAVKKSIAALPGAP
jgi:hypothetical protein